MMQPTMSRWGRSAYDTDAAWRAEAEELSGLVDVLHPERDAAIIVVNSKTRVDAGFLARTPSARLVVTSTSGFEHLDLAAIRESGAVAARLPLVRRDAVVDATLELMLTGLRQTRRLVAAAEEGVWARGALPDLPIRTLRGAHVGLVGLGVIGQAMASTLAAMGARLSGVDPAGLPEGVSGASMNELLARCDVVSLHASATHGAACLIGADELQHAHPGLVLLNTARGDLLDVDAAWSAVREGRIAFLGADVFPEEPWPRLATQARHPAVVFTPHSAGWHSGLPAAVTIGLEQVIAAFVAGQTLPFGLG